MPKSIRGAVAVWNVKDGLGSDKAEAIAQMVCEQNPSVVIIPEAASKLGHLNTRAVQLLSSCVGEVFEIPYDDADGRTDSHSLVVVSRLGGGEPLPVRIGGRNGALLRPAHDFSILGYHAFDRMPGGTRQAHEVQRVAQATAAMSLITTPNAIIAGDLNAMYPNTLAARLLRMAGPLADILPAGEPGKPQSRTERLGSLSQRLSAMAVGSSLAEYAQGGYRDADSTHAATMRLGPLAVQLDHILVKGAVNVWENRVVPGGELSDHDMVFAQFNEVA